MITAIIQARVASTRLPNKVFANLAGKPLIWHIVNRVSASERIEKVVLATSTNPLDDALETWARRNDVEVFRGSEQNVLSRYHQAAQASGASTIVRITADDPFKDPVVIDSVIEMYLSETLDFAYNNKPPSFPEGLDTEVFTVDALNRAARESRDPFEHEHVTQYFYRHPESFKQMNYDYKTDISNLRWTIDTEKDLSMARLVYEDLFQEKPIFLMDDILALIEQRPEIAKINSDVQRSAMYLKKNRNS